MSYVLTPRDSLIGSGWWEWWIGPAWPADAEWPVVALVVSLRHCGRLPRLLASLTAVRRVCSIEGSNETQCLSTLALSSSVVGRLWMRIIGSLPRSRPDEQMRASANLPPSFLIVHKIIIVHV